MNAKSDEYIAKCIEIIRSVEDIVDSGKVKMMGDGFVPVDVYSVEGSVVGVFGYQAIKRKEFEEQYPDLKPCPVDEVLEREPNFTDGVLAHCLVKKKNGRIWYVLDKLCVEITMTHADRIDDGDDPDPLPHNRIELDEEPQSGTVPEPDQAHDGPILDDAPYLELERLNRQLFALKQDKSDSNRDFNESIKLVEEQIQAQLRYLTGHKDQKPLPFDSAKDEPEKATYDSPGDVGVDDPPPDLEPEEELPEPEKPTENGPEPAEEPEGLPEGVPEPEARPRPCRACDGSGFEDDQVLCSVCNGEGVKPAPRGNGTRSLKCYACGAPRPAFSFQNFRDEENEDGPPLKGHVCSVCRSKKRPAKV
jgi:hypothetical protein